MTTWTDDEGNNYADEIDYKVWNPQLEMYQYISLDDAIGKIVVTTEVYDGQVTVYLKNIEDSP